jgi:hypothetical protein
MIGAKKPAKPVPGNAWETQGYTIAFPKMSPWGVKIAGKKSNFVIHPEEGGVPNFFHRWMQRLFLGFYWYKHGK